MDAKAQIYPSKRGLLRRKQWMARLVSKANGASLFRSSESYNNRGELVDLVEDTLPGIDIEILNDAGEVEQRLWG